MNALADFFAFRPVFTERNLRIVWIGFLVLQILPILSAIYGLQVSGSMQTIGSWTSFLFLLLPPAVTIVLVRVLLEVALAVLGQTPRMQPRNSN